MTIFDAHMHIFNGTILRDLVFPERLTPPVKEGIKVSQPVGAIGSWWDYMKEIAEVLADSEETNNQFVKDSLKDNFPNADSFATVPLMMDINFLFATPLDLGQNVPKGDLKIEDVHLNHQIKDLQALSAKGNCYPFFCVDPRRVGVIDAILNGQYITRKPGGFYGLKLYPRLGYHPMADRLPELYSYCAKNEIPIITHCSSGGFPPWNTSSGDFCNPENFRPALISYPDLKIDFAHFGNGTVQWGNSIVDLMKTYPNVYSDLACYTGDDDLIGFKNSFWSEEIVKERTFYGSDFDVFYFTKTDMDMNDYIQAFKDEFTPDELNDMMVTLPPKFLGL